MSPTDPAGITISPAARWERFWTYNTVVRDATSPTEALQLAADTIGSCQLYRRAVLTLHDHEGNLTAIGSFGLPAELINASKRAPRVKKEVREAVLQPRHKLSQSYFIPVEAGIAFDSEERHIPGAQKSGPPGGWQPGDELFTPLRKFDGDVIGFCSVDDPCDGNRPDDNSLRLLETIVGRAAEVIERFTQRAEIQSLQKHIERLASLTTDTSYTLDSAEHCFRSFDPGIEALTGYSATELVGVPVPEWYRRFIHPEDRDRLRAGPLWPAHNGSEGRATIIEDTYRILHRDGSVRWVLDRALPIIDDDGQIVACQGILHDVTPERRLAERLDEAEQQYRLLTDNVRDLIYAHDESNRMVYVSPSVEHYLGVTPEEFIGTHFSVWLTDNPINSKALEEFDPETHAARAGKPFILEIRATNGKTALIEFIETLVYDDTGRVVGAQGVGRDVTERENVLDSLREHRERLDAANAALKTAVHQSRRRQERAAELSRDLRKKNEELESFVQIVSHDLRSPLITLRGLASQLRRRYSNRLDPKGQTITQQLGNEAARLTRLVGDLLTYVRAGATDDARRPVDLRLMLDAVWTRLMDSRIATDVRLTRPESTARVWADPVAIEHVLENLLRNAALHRSPTRPPEITIHWAEVDGSLRVSIADNGLGIEPEDRPRIFELFYRGRNVNAEGSGLGLAIVKRIAETSSASIGFSPNPGGGSIFTLSWPTQPPASSAP